MGDYKMEEVIYMKQEILIADDQPGIRLLLNDILLNEGYHVTTATTGKEAADHLQSQSFDVVILDYKLPIMTGIEILQLMEKHTINTPAIMITGMKEVVQEEIARTGLKVAVMAKPFNIEDMCALTRDMLAND